MTETPGGERGAGDVGETRASALPALFAAAHWPVKNLARSRLTEDGPDYLLKAIILKPCAVRIEVCRSSGAPPPSVEVVDQSNAVAGFFERRIDARYRTHGHIVLLTLNDDEYCLHRMHEE